MGEDGISRLERLHDLVDQRLGALLGEMAEAGFELQDIVASVRKSIAGRVPEREAALEEASRSVSQDFISDGNEG